jgi:hypothetical protein
MSWTVVLRVDEAWSTLQVAVRVSECSTAGGDESVRQYGCDGSHGPREKGLVAISGGSDELAEVVSER